MRQHGLRPVPNMTADYLVGRFNPLWPLRHLSTDWVMTAVKATEQAVIKLATVRSGVRLWDVLPLMFRHEPTYCSSHRLRHLADV